MNQLFVRTASCLAVLGLLSATGCGSGGADTADGDDALEVVASFYPLQYVTERIAGENAEVTNLVPPGADAHDFELSGQEVATISEADLVVFLSEFQPAVDDAIASEASEAGFDVASAARLASSVELTEGDDAHGHDHDHHDHDHDHADDHDHDHEQDGGAAHPRDPHFWLDPTRLADATDEIATQMAELDPDNGDTYQANAENVRTDLTELDEEFAATLETCESRDLVTSHTAFGYLADRYGLTQVGISGLSPEAEPNTAQLARVTAFVRERDVRTVYYETLVNPAVAEVVASETGAETAQLDPLEGLTNESDGADYLTVMRANLNTLAEHQACS